MTTAEVSTLVKGREGTSVTLTVIRDDKELALSVERKRLNSVVATGVLLEENIGLITIANFDDRCAQETIAVIEDLRSRGAQALIFDVRNNPGGYKREMVELLDYLLPEGPLFRTVDYRGKEQVDSSDKKCLALPMAVIVNLHSYSASEFFAAALSEYDAAVTVGEKTFGKGYFQNTFELKDGSAVTLSVGKYYTPKGESLAGVGLTPDEEVSLTEQEFADLTAGNLPVEEDPQIQAAIQAVKVQKAP
jgi:carboxyl-terminal processing protease